MIVAAGVGLVRGSIAEAVAGFFKEPRNKELLKRFGDLGLTLQETATATVDGPASAATPRRSRPTIAQCWSCCAAAVA